MGFRKEESLFSRVSVSTVTVQKEGVSLGFNKALVLQGDFELGYRIF